jgi:hypothetical protein
VAPHAVSTVKYAVCPGYAFASESQQSVSFATYPKGCEHALMVAFETVGLDPLFPYPSPSASTYHVVGDVPPLQGPHAPPLHVDVPLSQGPHGSVCVGPHTPAHEPDRHVVLMLQSMTDDS